MLTEKQVFQRFFDGSSFPDAPVELLEASVFARYFRQLRDISDVGPTAVGTLDVAALTLGEVSEPDEVVAEPALAVQVTKVEARHDAEAAAHEHEKEAHVGLFHRIKAGLARTRSTFSEGVANLLLGKKQIDDALFEELETQMLVADVGVQATRLIIDKLTQRVSRKELNDSKALYAALQQEMKALLPANDGLLITDAHRPHVILMVGVNGVGKTTTIGKLAKRLQNEGRSVMLAAGDTFRAAAVEQLQVWGERNDIPVIAQHTGADSASVIFDALQAAKARNIDVLIADTAGRLHTKSNLMEELKKVKRVLGKLDDTAPHETMLVLDAGTGQNALRQAEEFNQTISIDSLVLTKLDGTAKGGILFAIANKLNLPIRFIGVGEKIDDLRLFDADEFVKALFATDAE